MTEFSAAFRAARKHENLRQTQLAAELELGTRTLIRWERGDAKPANAAAREAVVRWLRGLTDNPHAVEALVALGVVVSAPPAPPPPPPEPPSERVLSADEAQRAKLAIEHALLLAAEEHEVPAKGARQVVIAVLEAVVREEVPAKVAKGLLEKR